MASTTLCKSNLREVGHSLTLYRIENDGWLPVLEQAEDEIESVRSDKPWFIKLYPTYLDELLVLTCPKDPFRSRMSHVGTGLMDPDVADYSSYGINSFIMTSGNGFLADLDRHRSTRPLDTILVADLGPDDLTGAPTAGVVTGPARNASLLSWDDGFDPFTGGNAQPWLTTRHGSGINMLTIAGGVREARTSKLMREPMSRHYEDCAAGGCTFCTELRLLHYSFARDRLFWWTGPAPSE